MILHIFCKDMNYEFQNQVFSFKTSRRNKKNSLTNQFIRQGVLVYGVLSIKTILRFRHPRYQCAMLVVALASLAYA